MLILIVLLFILILAAAPRMIVVTSTRSLISTLDTVPEKTVAVVFGAGLNRDGTPTAVLRDRVSTAADLYFAGKVEKILMSGDNRFIDYNEPGSMKTYAITLGVPEDVIVLDYAGRRTYDTCYRAIDIFQVPDAILVTQQFHLYRALYTCRVLGLEAVGVPSDLRSYRNSDFWHIREIPASLIAFLQVHFTRPEPVLGDPEPIFPVE